VPGWRGQKRIPFLGTAVTTEVGGETLQLALVDGPADARVCTAGRDDYIGFRNRTFSTSSEYPWALFRDLLRRWLNGESVEVA